MTENKRFKYYEHKGADYILENPNEDLDFIEMLGDCLEAEEIVNRLNKLYDENEQLKQENQSWLRTASHVDNIAHKDKDYAKRMHNENEQLKKENEDLNEELMGYDSFVLFYKEQIDELKKENEVLKSTEMEYEDALGRLEKENEKLKKEKESWKSSACNNSSFNSILLHELDIAQEQGYKLSNPFKKLMREKND